MNELRLAPSILSADFLKLGEQIEEAEKAGADMLHFDVMDGNFVPEISYGEPILRAIKKNSRLPMDVHLMVVDPLKNIDSFAKAGADYITFHLEACRDARECIERIHANGVKASVSIRPDTPVEEVFPYLNDVEMVLLMTVNPGFGGQKYLPESSERIRALRAEIDRRGRSVLLEVDGGICGDTIALAAEAGADTFVSGSSVFCGDIPSNIRSLREKLTR